MNIYVVDSIMGSGKTSWSIQYMKQADKEKNFIYITPFLNEVKRVKNAVTGRNFIEPENKGKGKLDNFKKLIMNERDIVSTHALFRSADKDVIDLLKASNYTLILDEVMDVVEQFPLDRDDFKLLIDSGMVSVDEISGVVQWNDTSTYQQTKYNEIKTLSKSENLIFYENSILFWSFPISVFQAFTNVYVMTYLFEAQQQKYYFDMNEIEYEVKGVSRDSHGYYSLVSHNEKNLENRQWLKSLINIYDGKLNNIGEERNALSVSWFRRDNNKTLIDKLKKNIYTYFRRHAKTSSRFNLWTCFKDDKPKLKGNGYAGSSKNVCFIEHNARATNDFKHKQSLAYVVNKFMHPYEKKFFISRGVTVNEDTYALSTLLQWIWRSQIREGNPINLYIPSKRMRRLLEEYLDNNKEKD
ncbi:hypothetical protein GCM10010954_14520 [Halobacillus andaensis]|uniref:Uncharacterized protein n=1 Tax=Halobacillus andaensis TaxID=1176239 RepID=A0A917B1M4_HALAA|nr:hypothetical protein [Halobacillus andaensis]MBP2004256.1 hypothetical protein [Halobacillus andaensis]GGF16959.1 hypothetical protein GCM10010954_14520 [Halobacillus andaensis]